MFMLQKESKYIFFLFQIQNICYREYLPIILGPQKMAELGLQLGGGPTEYDPSVNPTIRTEFSTVTIKPPMSFNLPF